MNSRFQDFQDVMSDLLSKSFAGPGGPKAELVLYSGSPANGGVPNQEIAADLVYTYGTQHFYTVQDTEGDHFLSDVPLGNRHYNLYDANDAAEFDSILNTNATEQLFAAASNATIGAASGNVNALVHGAQPV